MISVSMRLLIVWALVVVASTLAPYDFGAISPVHEHSFKAFQYGSYERDPIDFSLNLLLFVPLGALVHHEGQSRRHKFGSILIVTGVVALLISTSVEYLQRFLPSRDSSLIDVVANVLGGLTGVFAERLCGASLAAYLYDLRVRMSRSALIAVLASLMVVELMTSGALQARTRLSNWSAKYPLLIGNEQTGDRPWRGRVFTLAITDGATSLASARRFSEGEPVAMPGSRIATFDFSGTPPYRDAAGYLPDLDWTDGARDFSDGGLVLPGRPWLRSIGPASRFADRLREANAFTVRIQCATQDTNQGGPARIVSNSSSTSFRNFTLGQQGTNLVFRLRTPQTGVNGYPPEIITPGVFSTNQSRDILLTYDGATLLTAISHGNRVFRNELNPSTYLAVWVASLTSQELHGGALEQMAKMAYLIGFFAPPGVLIGLLARAHRDRLVYSVGYLMSALLLEVTLVLASGRAFEWGNVAVNAGVGAVILTTVGMILWQADLPAQCGVETPGELLLSPSRRQAWQHHVT